jgi:hypothetical protein
MGKDRKDNNIDWGAMTRNNQYKDAPSISKQEVAAPKPAQATGESNLVKSLDKKSKQ